MGYIIKNGTPESDFSYLHAFSMNSAVVLFENKDVKALLEDPNEKFDAIIAEFLEIDIFAA